MIVEKQKAGVATATTRSKHKIEIQAFIKCSDIIADNLDISEIFPHLNSHELLTKYDCEILLNDSITDVKKVHHLIKVLPKKGEGFLEKFQDCLYQSENGTGRGHHDIADALQTTYKAILGKVLMIQKSQSHLRR